uniref:Uncharacterized protein n=1 Tax=Anguilla anguilla TaxID=7936 RepID=A0A0E9S145_ANGAN
MGMCRSIDFRTRRLLGQQFYSQ